MKHKFDKGCWELMKHCFSCHVKFETKMRIEGTRQDFIDSKHKSNMDALIKDVELGYKEWLDSRDGKEYITEAGTFEKWKGGQGRRELELIFNNRITELKNGVKNGKANQPTTS